MWSRWVFECTGLPFPARCLNVLGFTYIAHLEHSRYNSWNVAVGTLGT